MSSLLNKIDWETGNWINQLLFFAASCFLVVHAELNDTWRDTWLLYIIVTAILLIASLVNVIIFNKNLKYLFALTIIMANVFIIPLSFYSFGRDINFIISASLVYVIITFAISPRFVGFCVLISSLAFSCYLHNKHNVFEKHPIFKEEVAELEKSLLKEGVAPVATKDSKYYLVKKPMTLKQISALPEVYGNEDYFNTLYKANRNQLKNAWLKVPSGTRLLVPKTKGSPFKVKEYVVPRENSLKAISRKMYDGNSSNWKYIYEANKSILGDPKLPVLAGTKLIIPEVPKMPYADFLKISLAYLAAAGIAYCWRLLVQNMYQLYYMALRKTSTSIQKEIGKVKSELEKTNNEFRLLKEEAAMTIVEMNKISGFEKNGEENKDAENKEEEKEGGK